jgi:uncharacterized membrane protein
MFFMAKRYQKIIYTIILVAAILWCAGIIVAPVWSDCSDLRGDISGFLYTFYGKSCHQLEQRSMAISGYKFGVCSRCTFIYFAFLASTIFYPFTRKLSNTNMPPVWVLLAGAGLVALDAGLDLFDVVKNTFITREVTGAVLGGILPFFIIPGTIRIFDEFFQ